jgi:AbiJ N-terminal domain 4
MIFETFAYRKRHQSRNGEPEVYTYDQAPDQLRHQICMALSDGIGPFRERAMDVVNANRYWRDMDKICRKEVHSYLRCTDEHNLEEKFLHFLQTVDDMDDFLSGVEIGCVVLSLVDDKKSSPYPRGAEQTGAKSIQEINQRFKQHAVGYQFENGQIIRVDSKFTHAEIIKPALSLLAAPIFVKANEDFMTAHRHYGASEFKDCVTAAHRAFESMLKAICDTEGWDYDKGDRASELVTRVTDQGLFTHDFDRSFTAFVAMLKAGLPAIRNDAGGHGEGIAAAAVTAQIARFALNLTASNILFLGGSYDALKRQKSSGSVSGLSAGCHDAAPGRCG